MSNKNKLRSFIFLLLMAIVYALSYNAEKFDFIKNIFHNQYVDPVKIEYDGKLLVTFIDVGQGDSTFIRTPSGKTIVMDGGGGVNAESGEAIGRNVVIPFLRHMGVSKIDMIILTHAHGDHILGLMPILESMPVERVIDTGFQLDNDYYRSFRSIVDRKNISCTRVYEGKIIDFNDGVKAYILNPPDYGEQYQSESLNDDSMVVRLVFGNNAFLFMGDAGAYPESRILETGSNIRSNVIKIGHHGSRFSTTDAFIKRCNPEIAVISVGVNNNFGHPSHRTLDKLRRNNVKVYRTDRNGAITMISDGKGRIDVYPYKGN